MAKLEVATDLPLDPQTAWEKASDLEAFGDWLSIHDGWRGELPDTLEAGVVLQSVVSVKGMRNRWSGRSTSSTRRTTSCSAGPARAAPSSSCGSLCPARGRARG